MGTTAVFLWGGYRCFYWSSQLVFCRPTSALPFFSVWKLSAVIGCQQASTTKWGACPLPHQPQRHNRRRLHKTASTPSAMVCSRWLALIRQVGDAFIGRIF